MTSTARQVFAGVGKMASGIMFCGSLIRKSDVSDGASNTYLAGEKYLNPDFYLNGGDNGDNECAMMGDNQDIVRWSGLTPTAFLAAAQDTPGNLNGGNFGAPDASGFNMALCDGSVRSVSYTIDLQTHRRLSNRNDGLPVDSKNL